MIINALHRNNASHRNIRMIIMLRKIKKNTINLSFNFTFNTS